MRNVALRVVFWVWMSVLTWLSLRRVNNSDSWINDLLTHPDKILHFGAYALTALLGLLAYTQRDADQKKQWLVVFACWFWSVVMEMVQLIAGTGRHFEVLDIIANIIGCFAGVAAFRFIFKERHYGSK